MLVGANASGKSNLADCIDFVSEVYRHGLEVAIARKGGYENIAHRKQRRSKGAISVEMTILFDLRRPILQLFSRNNPAPITVKAKHLFSFRAKSRAIKADFQVEQEALEFHLNSATSSTFIASIKRTSEGIEYSLPDEQTLSDMFPQIESNARRFLFGLEEVRILHGSKRLLSPSALVLESVGRTLGIYQELIDALSNIRVYQLSPAISRGFSAPTPRPELN